MLIFYRMLPVVLLLSIGLAGCGQKGKLYLSTDEKKQEVTKKQNTRSSKNDEELL